MPSLIFWQFCQSRDRSLEVLEIVDYRELPTFPSHEYKRVGILRVKVSKRVGKTAIKLYKKGPFKIQTYRRT